MKKFFYYPISIAALIILSGLILFFFWTSKNNPRQTTPPPQPTTINNVVFYPVIYVSADGQDHDGAASEQNPYRTINFALSRAQSATTIIIRPGQYQETLTTYASGQADQPITLKSSGGSVKITGNGQADHLFTIKHDYYIIDGLELSHADILLWLEGGSHNTIKNSNFHDADGECIRLKYHSTDNLLTNNSIKDCGLKDFTKNGGGKNGEGIYIGTAPEQLNKNPSPETDHSNNNTISHNSIVTNGNECVDIKEVSANNLIEYNDCSGQKDPESAGFDSRGNKNIFRYNQSHDNLGAGIRLGGDANEDGINNEAYSNKLFNNQGYAIKIIREPQGKICGNEESNNQQGFTNSDKITNQPCPQ